MAEPDEEFVVDFPTLWVVPDWIEAHCIVPDGFRKGAPFVMYDWQLWCTVNHYRIRPSAVPAGTEKADGTTVAPASAFTYRRSQVIAPQKTGKGPWSAAIICAEAVGPVVFAGLASGGEAYECSDHGCSCGWGYEYQVGEPMGRPWPTPLIQLLATAEDQTDNVYRPLQSMAKHGPLAEQLRVGEEFIRCPNDGRIDVVTSSAQARLGNPTTFALQDESGIYTVTNKMVTTAETQRRGVAGMGGRSMETTNPPDPTLDTTAKRTRDSKKRDIFRFWRPPPDDLDYAKKLDRRRIHEYVYAGSNHVDLDTIDAEAEELFEVDQAQAERFFGNRMAAGSGKAFPLETFRKLGDPRIVIPPGELIVIGVDGARFKDALAIVATDVISGHQWPLCIIERPENASDDYEHDFNEADAKMVAAFKTWQVWRVYIDPQYIEKLVERWSGRWGDDVIVEWYTGRQRPMAFALQAYRQAMVGGDLSHDGDPTFITHVGNATKRTITALDDDKKPMWLIEKPEPLLKIDACMAGCISWECRSDARVAGAVKKKRKRTMGF